MDDAWVFTRDELITSGWFGAVRDEVRDRIGDVVIAAKGLAAFYPEGEEAGRSMIGQHGSMTPEELRVPLLRFGAYAD